MISQDKDGEPKQITFHHWCRKIAKHAQASGNATEHADYTTEQNTNSYKSVAIEMLKELTTPAQRRKPEYTIHHNKETSEVTVTEKLRGWINVMLSKTSAMQEWLTSY